MTTKYWLGVADAVAQVHTGSIDSVDGTPADNTFTVTIGGVAISAVGDTDVATTATALRASLNASVHPYFAAITWSGSAGDIIGTADTAGVPFVAVLTETGVGAGAVTDFAATTASAGPNDWGTAANWSDGSIPGNADTVIFRENSINVCWGLDHNAVTINDLFIEKSYTGKIGLNRSVFVTSADGETSDSSKPEYRDHYLKIDYDVLEIGKNVGGGNPAGSGRIKIDNQNSGVSTSTIFDTANTSTETTLAAVRLLAASASADFYIRDGLVGIAIDEATETSTVGDVYVNDSGAKVYIGSGVTLTSLVQSLGTTLLEAAATITAVTVLGGILTTEGNYTITTLNQEGGTINCNHASGGSAITTANLNGGTIIATQSSEPRTWATVNIAKGATLKANSDILTITTLNEPSNEYSLSVG